MINNSVYTGTEIIFDFNEANTYGGAIFATKSSQFICSSCTFTDNKGEKGGAIYVENFSQM